jgi:uncharacterized protein (TIGR00251 family)
MVQFEVTSAGIMLPVKAQAGARRNGVVGTHAGSLKVAVTQTPEKGKANEAILDVLVSLLNLKRGQIQLSSGATSSQKKFLITGLSIEELRQRVENLSAG